MRPFKGVRERSTFKDPSRRKTTTNKALPLPAHQRGPLSPSRGLGFGLQEANKAPRGEFSHSTGPAQEAFRQVTQWKWLSQEALREEAENRNRR